MKCCSDGNPVVRAIAAHASALSSTSWLLRISALVQWAIPITTLALIPKCPGCVAGYVLLFTGLGISFTTATAMRWSLILISIAALAYLAFRTARRIIAFFTRPA